MVRKRKRKDEEDVVIEEYEETPVEIANEEARTKKRNLHGRYKKKKIPQVLVEKVKCIFKKEDDSLCGKGVHKEDGKELSEFCRKHAGVKRVRKEKVVIEVVEEKKEKKEEKELSTEERKKIEDNNIRLKAIEKRELLEKKKREAESNFKISTTITSNNKKIVFDDDD